MSDSRYFLVYPLPSAPATKQPIILNKPISAIERAPKPSTELQTKDINSKEILQKSFFSFYKDGFLVAGTSPKAWLFFPLIFPQFIDFNSNYVVQFFILITTYVVLDFLSLIGYALLAQKLITWIKANPKTINTISAGVLIFIALIIIITQHY